MKILKFIYGSLVLLFLGQAALAQQETQFTQYFDNMLYVNPAYAGSSDMLSMALLHREQWVGFEGRPRSTAFNIHSPLKYKSLGLGLSTIGDRIGPLNQTMVYGDFSYTLRFKNHEGKLALGLKGGFNLINIYNQGLNAYQTPDPALSTLTRNKINPNFGFGAYYYNSKFFVGFSIPKLIESSYDRLNTTNLEQRHYYTTIGGIIEIPDTKWKFRPSALLKITSNAPVGLDLTAAGIYNDFFWLGLNYRLQSSIGMFIQFQIVPPFRIGFASDFGTQTLRDYNHGTFEFLLSYDFNFKRKGVRSPRYF